MVLYINVYKLVCTKTAIKSTYILVICTMQHVCELGTPLCTMQFRSNIKIYINYVLWFDVIFVWFLCTVFKVSQLNRYLESLLRGISFSLFEFEMKTHFMTVSVSQPLCHDTLVCRQIDSSASRDISKHKNILKI